jgi:diguanylate cyclase (GGDEF)-like protein
MRLKKMNDPSKYKKSLNIENELDSILEISALTFTCQRGFILLSDNILSDGKIIIKKGVSQKEINTISSRAKEILSFLGSPKKPVLIGKNQESQTRVSKCLHKIKGSYSIIINPLRARGRLIGGIFLLSHQDRNNLTRNESALLLQIGDHASQIIEKAKTFSTVLSGKEYYKGKTRELELINQFAFAVSSSLDLSNVMDTILSESLNAVSCDVSILLFHAKEGIYITMHSSIPLNDFVLKDIKRKTVENFGKRNGYDLSNENIIFKINGEEESSHNNKVVLIPSVKKTETSFPLIAGQKEIGILSCVRFLKTDFKKNDLLLLSKIAEKSANALHNAYQYRVINEMARIDSLTQTHNYRVFHEILEREFNRYKRYKNMLSLIMLDIDNFKDVNDNFGHQVGDQILKEIVSLLSDCARETDIIARYGGDEFAIILPETSKEDAYIMAERMRKKISSYQFQGSPKPLNLTISLGVSHLSYRGIKDKDALVYLADEALYLAKANGRNQTCIDRSETGRLKLSG